MNVGGPEARGFQLVARRLPAVEVPMLGTSAGPEPPIDVRGRKPRGREARAHVGAHLVAIGADGRSDDRNEILRSAAELARQRVDGDRRHARGQSAPARVRRRHDAGSRISDEQRDAVRGLNRQRGGWISRDDDIRVWSARPVTRAVHNDGAAVHLMHAHEVREIDVQRGRNLPPVRVGRDDGGPERPGARRKEVIRERLERAAHKR